MTFRILFVALWGFFLGYDIDSDRAWKPFWLALDVLMIVWTVAYAVRQHNREVEKARSVRLWRTR